VPIVVPTQLECLFATIVAVGSTIAGCERPPSEVRFVHACRASVSEYERHFGCPVTFGADRYEVRCPRAYLDAPLRGGSADARDTLTLLAERTLFSLRPRMKSFLASVRESATNAIADRDESLVSVAKRLGTSGRTLQRRLAGEGVSYETVLDDLRKAMALTLLVDAKLPITRVARMVGFANPSAFTRAFRRWTGKSPQAYARAEASGKRSPSIEIRRPRRESGLDEGDDDRSGVTDESWACMQPRNCEEPHIQSGG
jgi:AraC-like DNA-binding protein